MLKNAVTLILLTLSTAIAVISAVTDSRKSKIYNKMITAGFGVLLPLIAVYYGICCRQLFFSYIMNITLALTVSGALYAGRVWAAGDAKLACLLAAAMPLAEFQGLSGIFPAFYLFVAAFSAAYLYIIGESIMLSIKHFDMLKLRISALTGSSTAMRRQLSAYILGVLMSALIFNLLLRFAPDFYAERRLEASILTFVMLTFMFSVIHRGFWILSAVIFAVNVSLVSVFRAGPAVHLSLSSFLIAALFIVLRFCADTFNYRLIRPNELKAGMVLSLASAIFLSAQDGVPLIQTDETAKSRLNAEQILTIQRWCGGLTDEKREVMRFSIVRLMPFTVFVLLGTLAVCAGGVMGIWKN